jgi:tetratricopeptide (TPR) repeat protein
MIDQAKASKLAREAFDQWQAGQHEQSRLLYEEAIPLADPQHYGLSGYYGEYACVLNQLGEREQAATALEKSLTTEIAQGSAEGTSPMIIARYFLADQLLRLGYAERALETLSPSISHAPDNWLTRVEEAHILHALDRKVEAKAAATLALACAPTPEKAEQLRQNLHEILGDP